MFKQEFHDRAQVGIGTLIVFIAMVLVAAIAAGVLVDTAGMLQSKSQQTGEDSTDAVTNRLEVVDTYGVVNNLDPDTGGADGDDYYTTGGSTTTAVYELNFVVMKSPGSGNIQLDKTVMMVKGPNGAYQDTLGEDATSGTEQVDVTSIDGASDDVLDEQSDRAKITLTLDPHEDGSSNKKDPALDYLTSGQTVTIQFTTVSGATVTKTVSIPSTLPSSGDSVVDL